MERIVLDELLDSLPHDHPDCVRSRRDLRWLNHLMGSYRWLERTLGSRLRSGDRLLEMGAGSGDLLRRVERRWGKSHELDLHGLDLCPPPTNWRESSRWWSEDVLAFDGYSGYDIVVANLLLHQFEDEELAALGRRLQTGPRLILACEPARRSLHLAQLRFLGRFGRLGRVTRHDGVISIRAGFLGDELPQLLGLDSNIWSWRCSINWRGRYCMAAWRKQEAAR